MLCFDSAVTGKSGDLPTFEVSSFGEKQDVDGVPVEERVLKLVDVAGMPVLLSGDAATAMQFCRRLKVQMTVDTDVRRALGTLHTSVKADPAFTVVIAHMLNDRAVLTEYSSRDGIASMNEPMPGVTFQAGSLPDSLKRLVQSIVTLARSAGLDAESELMTVVSALQMMGLAHYLPSFGVGGTFVGARFGSAGLVWQSDIVYMTTTAERLALAGGRGVAGAFDTVRVRLVEGKAVVGSSINRSITLLQPPRFIGDGTPDEALSKLVDDPGSWVGPAKYFALAHAGRQRVVLVVTRTEPLSDLITVVDSPDPKLRIVCTNNGLRDELLRSLEPNKFEVIVLVEKTQPHTCSRYRATVDLLGDAPPGYMPTVRRE